MIRIWWIFTVQPSRGDNRLMFDDLDPLGLSFFHSHEIGLLNIFGSAGIIARVALDTGKTAAPTTLRPYVCNSCSSCHFAVEPHNSCWRETGHGHWHTLPVVTQSSEFRITHGIAIFTVYTIVRYSCTISIVLTWCNCLSLPIPCSSLVALSAWCYWPPASASPKTPRSMWRVLYLIKYV